MAEIQEVYENPNVPTIKKPSKFWYLAPIFLSIIGGIVGYIVIKDKDRKMARNILIIGIVILVIEVVLAGFIYASMTSQPITTQNTSNNNTSETNKNETETNLTSNVIEFGKLKPVNWTFYSNGSLYLNVLSKFEGTIKLTSVFTDSGIYEIPNGILIDSNQTSDYILAKLMPASIGNTKSSYALKVTLYYQYQGHFFSSTGTLTGYRDVQNSM